MILIEGISVVVRASALDRYPGGWPAFKAAVPNETLCGDGELVRVGFMHVADVEAFVRELEQLGLHYIVDGRAEDLVVIDQLRGFMVPCEWADAGTAELSGGRKIAWCRLKGSNGGLITPEGWEWETSLSASFAFVPLEHEATLVKIGEAEGMEEYRSPLMNKPLYMGRTTNPIPEPN